MITAYFPVVNLTLIDPPDCLVAIDTVISHYDDSHILTQLLAQLSKLYMLYICRGEGSAGSLGKICTSGGRGRMTWHLPHFPKYLCSLS